MLFLLKCNLTIAPSVALLLHFHSLFSFQGAVEGCTLKIEQCKKSSKVVLRLLDELGAALRAPQ